MSGLDVVIEVNGLSKRYQQIVAVDHIQFELPRGRIYALLGGNGAGKTTTLSMLLGLLLPTSGQITIFGHDMLRNRYAVLPKMNFSSPYVDLPQRLSVRENLMVYGKLYGIRRPLTRIKQLAEDLRIDHLLRKAYGDLSAGQRTRVSLAKSLLNNPELLLMDEPTASLDPDSADRVRRYLQNYQQQSGCTVLLASHNMQEVEMMCEHVIMMKAGRIVDQDSPLGLTKKYGRADMEQVFLTIARDDSV